MIRPVHGTSRFSQYPIMRSFKISLCAYLVLGLAVHAIKTHIPERNLNSIEPAPTPAASNFVAPGKWTMPEIPPEKMMDEIAGIRKKLNSPLSDLTWIDESESTELFQQMLFDEISQEKPTRNQNPSENAMASQSSTADLADQFLRFADELRARGKIELGKEYRQLADEMKSSLEIRLAQPPSLPKYK